MFLLKCSVVPYSCIGTPNIVSQEDTPQVGSLLPIGLNPISDGHIPNARICISNSRIGVRAIMT